MTVPADEYEESMNAEGNFKLTASIRVVDTNQMFAQTEAFVMKKPALEFEVIVKNCPGHENS